MRKRNWKEYNKALVQRGSLTFLIDPKSLKTVGPIEIKKKRAAKRVFKRLNQNPFDDQNSF